MATPEIFSSSGINSPGIFFSTIKVNFGSGESSGSSTIACRMLKPALFSSMAALERIPGDLAFTGVISKTPRLRCLAISFRECPAGRISSKIIFNSGLALMVQSVSLTVRRSTPATLAMRTGGISIWFR